MTLSYKLLLIVGNDQQMQADLKLCTRSNTVMVQGSTYIFVSELARQKHWLLIIVMQREKNVVFVRDCYKHISTEYCIKLDTSHIDIHFSTKYNMKVFCKEWCLILIYFVVTVNNS